ncbi:MAG: DNA starvation/stationary phase protection protein [Chloroherpetonaceae bacterium]|nr:DNA starvation/stationary phase protection protein [Chloroherpetonaceae bacterium]MDW8438168.1 DNA starvation/stationary phase protection protein [Chloroherpetonaceae bacterium]
MSTEVRVKHTTPAVMAALDQHIASAAMLSTKYKKFHWYVSGPFFKSLHELFDEHYKQLIDIIDDLAERSRAIGGYPVGTMREFIELSLVSDADGTMFSPLEMVETLHADTDKIIDALHEHIQLATKDNDPGTADILTQVTQVYQKQAWYLAETKARKVLGEF